MFSAFTDITYDDFLTYSLAEDYARTRDPEVLNDILLQLSPLVNTVVVVEIGDNVMGTTKEELKVDALSRLYEILFNGWYPLNHPQVFKNFMYRAAHRTMIDHLRKSMPQVFNCWKKCTQPYPEPSRPDDANYHIYAAQIRKMILELFESEIRFKGKDREACIFMARCLLGFARSNPLIARAKYTLTTRRCEYLLGYVRLMIKRISYWFKEFDENIGS